MSTIQRFSESLNDLGNSFSGDLKEHKDGEAASRDPFRGVVSSVFGAIPVVDGKDEEIVGLCGLDTRVDVN